MGILLRIILVGIIASSAAQASLAAYAPYEGRGLGVAAYPFPVAAAKDHSLQRIELNNYNIYSHIFLARMLLRIEQTAGLPILPNFIECAEQLKSEPAMRDICAVLEKPERGFISSNLFDPGVTGIASAMNSLEENLDTILTPMAMQAITFSWFDEDTSQKIRRAFLRLRLDSIEKSLLDARSKLSPIAAVDHAALLSRVREIDREGKNHYRRDAEAIVVQGRKREPLPFTNLPDEDRRLLSMYLYAMLWRFRGGGFIDEPKGTQLTRLYFALRPYDVISHLNGAPNSRFGFDQMRRLVAEGWGRWFDMGRNPMQEDEAHDLLNMTRRGVYQAEGARMMLEGAGYDASSIHILSHQIGVCYLFAWERLERFRVLPDLRPPFQGFFDSPTAWAEMCTGGALGLGLAESLLAGRKD